MAQMDWLTFISNMTSALAWPVVIAAIAFFYRKEIRHFIAGFRKLKVGPIEAEMFELKVREIRQLAVSLPERTIPLDVGPKDQRQEGSVHSPAVPAQGRSAPREPAVVPASDLQIRANPADVEDDLLNTVEEAMRNGTEAIAIRSTWNLVEDALRSFAERNGSNPKATVVTMLLDLKRNGLLSLEEYQLLRQLYELRNTAAMTTIMFRHETLLDYVVAASEILRKTGLSATPGRSASLRSVPFGERVAG
jgi:hypothetical protein